MADRKQPENMEYYNYLGSTITREIKFRIAMVKAAFNNKKTQFTSEVDFWKVLKCGAGKIWRSIGPTV